MASGSGSAARAVSAAQPQPPESAPPRPTPSSIDLSAQIFKRLDPVTYLSRFLENGIREDGRAKLGFRGATAVVGSLESAQGSCLVRLGHTVVLAGVKAEVVAKPSPPDRGCLVSSVELPPLASPRFRPGAPSELAQTVTERVQSTLDASPPLETTELLIQYGEAAWCLYLDVMCLSYDGNLLDACMLAVAGALRDTKLPSARWDEEAKVALCSPLPQDQQPLPLLALPLTCSFGISEGTHLLSDPSSFEADLVASSLAISHVSPLGAASPPPAPPSAASPSLCGVRSAGQLRAHVAWKEVEVAVGTELAAEVWAADAEDEAWLEWDEGNDWEEQDGADVEWWDRVDGGGGGVDDTAEDSEVGTGRERVRRRGQESTGPPGSTKTTGYKSHARGETRDATRRSGGGGKWLHEAGVMRLCVAAAALRHAHLARVLDQAVAMAAAEELGEAPN